MSRHGSLDALKLLACSSVLVYALGSGAALAQSQSNDQAATPTPQVEETEETVATTTTAEATPELQEAEQMVGQKVVNQQGEELGKVDSIVRDKQTQQLSAVIASGGFLGMGEKKMVVPLDQLQMEQASDQQAMGPQDQQSSQQGPDDDAEPARQVVLQQNVTPDNMEQELASYDAEQFEEVQLEGQEEEQQTATTEETPAQGAGQAGGSE